jgi:hypothetical protein
MVAMLVHAGTTPTLTQDGTMVPVMVIQEALGTSRTAIDRLCEGMLYRQFPLVDCPVAVTAHRSVPSLPV